MTSISRYILAMLIVLTTHVTAQSQVVINELMQSNVDLIMDDLIDFPDSWVELYNKGPEPISLAGYKLGVTKDPAKAWKLPSETLAAYTHKLVYCDKVGDSWHTNFRLESGKGCVVYLFSGDNLVDQVDTLKKQPAPNIAYGRESDGSDKWGYELNPTPGSFNYGGICKANRILGNPVFSEPGSVKTDGSPIQLTLSLPEDSPEGTLIYYTVTGDEPTRGSILYTGPINISGATVIRAKLICDGWLSPRSTTHSYIIFPRKMTLPVVSIATSDFFLNDSRTGIFANNNTDVRSYQHNWRRPINLEYFEKEGKKSKLNQICEVRVAGGFSRSFPKKTMNIYAHKRFGEKQFKYEFFPDQKPGLTKFKSLALRNAGNDFEFLYLRDALAQRMMGLNTDIDWQAWRPAIVYINGQYYGLLNIRERSDEDNIYTNYNELEDIDLYENWDNLKEGDDEHLLRFMDFYAKTGHTMAEYEKWMDCREFINLMIMSLYNVNLDFPGGNIIMWRPRADGGRWRWIAKDVDYSFGYGGYGHIPYNYNVLEWFYNPKYDKQYNWANGEPYTRLFRRLMEDNTFKNEFIERYAIYAGDFLNYAGIRKQWDAMYDKIRYELPYFRASIPNFLFADYNSEMSFVDDWIRHRTDAFMQQIVSFYRVTSTLHPLTINTAEQEGPLSKVTFNDHALSEIRFNGKYFKDHPIRLTGTPSPKKALLGWRVKKTVSGVTETQDYNGFNLNMTMPQCDLLTIEPISMDRLIGDFDGEGTIDSNAIDEMVAVIMGNLPENFILEVYDLNNDGKVNAADMVLLVNSIKPQD